MSLLKRINQQPNNNNQNNNNSPFNGNNNNQQNNRFSGRRSNNNNQQNNQPAPDPNTYVDTVVVPTGNTVVRFGLAGLGDPFYRVLGHKMDPDMGDVTKLAAALEAGSERADELTAKLDETWASYGLSGAMLVFRHDNKVARALAVPTPMPMLPGDGDADDDDDDENKQDNQKMQVARLRAIDPVLVLNVLSRARSQVLLAGAPVVYGHEYMRRQLVTDDARLVALAQATGCLPDA